MPVEIGKDTKGCFSRWGRNGKKYYYTCGDKKALGQAKYKAYLQGLAATGGIMTESFVKHDFSLKEEAVSDIPWSNVDKSKLPKSAFLWIEGDGKKKSQWHLPYKDEQGRINLGALRAISAAIAGARTGKPMNIPSDVRTKINNLLKKYKIGEYAKKKEGIGTLGEIARITYVSDDVPKFWKHKIN